MLRTHQWWTLVGLILGSASGVHADEDGPALFLRPLAPAGVGAKKESDLVGPALTMTSAKEPAAKELKLRPVGDEAAPAAVDAAPVASPPVAVFKPAPALADAKPIIIATAVKVDDACEAFKSLGEGKYEVTFQHPYTGCPATVCFCLPSGCHEVCCAIGPLNRKIVFSYEGCFNDVTIRFWKNGKVTVSYCL